MPIGYRAALAIWVKSCDKLLPLRFGELLGFTE
jgi:hypothetical protein